MVPWMYLGWASVRQENMTLAGVFVLVSLIMLGGWGGLFVLTTFRRTFMKRLFSAGISSASSNFTLACTILGIICIRDLDKGLNNFRKRSPVFPEWGAEPLVLANAKERLPGDDFTPVAQDSEKSPMVQFPSSAPFEVVFNRGQDGRFTREDLPTVGEYSQTPVGSMGSVRRSPPARMASDGSSQGLKRSGTNGSDRSTKSSSDTTGTYAVAGSHHAIMPSWQRISHRAPP